MDLSAIKTQLEAAANEDYQKTLESVKVERPSDQDLFKENESTAAVVEEVIRYDAEAEKIRAAYASDTYQAGAVSGATRTSKQKAVEAEVVQPTSSVVGGWGSYYGTSRTATSPTVETQREKERRKIDEEIDKAFDEIVEHVFSEEDDFDIFSMHEQAAERRAFEASFGGDRVAYQKYQKKIRYQAKCYGIVLKVCKNALKTFKKAMLDKGGI